MRGKTAGQDYETYLPFPMFYKRPGDHCPKLNAAIADQWGR